MIAVATKAAWICSPNRFVSTGSCGRNAIAFRRILQRRFLKLVFGIIRRTCSLSFARKFAFLATSSADIQKRTDSNGTPVFLGRREAISAFGLVVHATKFCRVNPKESKQRFERCTSGLLIRADACPVQVWVSIASTNPQRDVSSTKPNP